MARTAGAEYADGMAASARVQHLLSLVAELSEAERDEFLGALDGAGERTLSAEDWDAAWGPEIRRRADDVIAGRAKTIPAGEAIAAVRTRLAERR